MSTREPYPVSMRLKLLLTVVNDSFSDERFDAFCDHVVAEAYAQTGHILRSGNAGPHASSGFDGKRVWSFAVQDRDVTFSRFADVQALMDELHTLRTTLEALAHVTRQATIETRAYLHYRPEHLPRKDEEVTPVAIAPGVTGIKLSFSIAKEGEQFLALLKNAGFILKEIRQTK